MSSLELPKVSVVIPARNEEEFIEKCIMSFIDCDYPSDLVEVIVVDGMSEDKTKEIVIRIAEKDHRVLLIDNEKQITPVAMNLGVKASKGEYIFFSGAHSEMSSDYISKCIKHALETGADNVGGVMKTEPRVKSTVGIAIAKVLSSPFGVGGAKFRTGVSKPAEVDTVPFGCYKRDVFERIGYFNEKLVRNQDIEFNLRLRRAGGRIILFPDIELTYYSRSTYKELCKNSFGNGYWVIAGTKNASVPFSLRHMVPLLFVLYLVLGSILSLVSIMPKALFPGTIILYLIVVISSSLSVVRFVRSWKALFAAILAFVTLHISYGMGSMAGLFSLISRREDT